MDAGKLRQLLKKEEGPKLDFKAELHLVTESDKKELTKDVSAIANSRGGRGYIIYGVEDKSKRLLGIEPGDFKEEQIQQIIYNRSDPPVPVSVEFQLLDGKMLAVITIFRSVHYPHQMLQTGAFYVRRGSTTDVARRSEIAGMFQESGLMTYETVVVKNAAMEDLDIEGMGQYFNALGTGGKPGDVLLEALGFIGEDSQGTGYLPTIGGLLLFGRNPWHFLPHVYVKVIRGEETQYFYGNILKMLEDTMSYLKEKLLQKDYPFDALEETLANALVHRDYLDLSRGVLVCITDRVVEISNPGALIPGNSMTSTIKENNPNRRNSWLYQRLITVDPKRRFMKWGTGMTRVREAFKEIGEVKYINIGSQNLFKVILPR